MNHDLQEGTLNKITTETESRNKITLNIAQSIAKILTEDHSWANTAIKNAYLHPYKSTEFQKRTHHYSLEKEQLGESFSEKLVEYLELQLQSSGLRRIYILVDSGSTFIPFMNHLAKKLSKHGKIEMFCERIRVITNNLAAVDAYLFPDGKELPKEKMVPLHILPGRPSADYRAVTSPYDPNGRAYIEEYLDKIISQKRKDEGSKEAVKVISLITGNWIGLLPSKSSKGRILPHVYARGNGHPEFKQKLMDVADEIFVVTPLAKLIHLPIDEFNDLLESLGETSKSMRDNPKQYEIINPVAGKTRLITTHRKSPSMLASFSGRLQGEMKILAKNKKYDSEVSWNLQQFTFEPNPSNRREEEEIEFPHAYTRNKEFRKSFD